MKASIDRISRDHLVLVPLDPTEQGRQWSKHIVYSVLILVTVAIVAVVLAHS